MSVIFKMIILFVLLYLQILQIYRPIALCPSQRLRHKKNPMYTHATSRFYGRECFGNISIQMEANNKPERTCYA